MSSKNTELHSNTLVSSAWIMRTCFQVLTFSLFIPAAYAQMPGGGMPGIAPGGGMGGMVGGMPGMTPGGGGGMGAPGTGSTGNGEGFLPGTDPSSIGVGGNGGMPGGMPPGAMGSGGGGMMPPMNSMTPPTPPPPSGDAVGSGSRSIICQPGGLCSYTVNTPSGPKTLTVALNDNATSGVGMITVEQNCSSPGSCTAQFCIYKASQLIVGSCRNLRVARGDNGENFATFSASSTTNVTCTFTESGPQRCLPNVPNSMQSEIVPIVNDINNSNNVTIPINNNNNRTTRIPVPGGGGNHGNNNNNINNHGNQPGAGSNHGANQVPGMGQKGNNGYKNERSIGLLLLLSLFSTTLV